MQKNNSLGKNAKEMQNIYEMIKKINTCSNDTLCLQTVHQFHTLLLRQREKKVTHNGAGAGGWKLNMRA